MTGRLYLIIPLRDVDEAQALGAVYDAVAGLWYAPTHEAYLALWKWPRTRYTDPATGDAP